MRHCLLRIEEIDSCHNTQLLLNCINIAKHPQGSDLSTVRFKKGTASPLDAPLCSFHTKKFTLMRANEGHPSCGLLSCIHDVNDIALKIREARADFIHIANKPFRSYACRA